MKASFGPEMSHCGGNREAGGHRGGFSTYSLWLQQLPPLDLHPIPHDSDAHAASEPAELLTKELGLENDSTPRAQDTGEVAASKMRGFLGFLTLSQKCGGSLDTQQKASVPTVPTSAGAGCSYIFRGLAQG